MKILFSALISMIIISGKSQTGIFNTVENNYIKIEKMIPMRDGINLFTAIYLPKDTAGNYSFLMMRTPYSCNPYGENNYRQSLGPNGLFASEKFIYVYQDVRGRYMSEGKFEEMTPAINNKKSAKEADESSDTYDTVDWLLKNIQHNNGKVGIYGISYPGFYASASLPDAHPAIKAVSPQAPVTDEFEGDDAYHRGAFFLMDNFSFMNFFDHPREEPWKKYPPVNDSVKIEDAYDFYLKMGPVKNANNLYFHNRSKIWNEYLQHNTKDEYWQVRNIRPHLKNIKPAVLVVGGWFDAEDMFGALKTYEAIEKQSPENNNRLVMGPWTHGAWESGNWNRFAGYQFGSNTSAYFQKMELDFFNYYLNGKGNFNAGEATIFVTGSNEWKTFSTWPAKETVKQTWYLQAGHQLSNSQPGSTNANSSFDEYISDPANPVPYINQKSDDRVSEYMAADQSFASQRPDVLYYTSKELPADITLCGASTANLFVSTNSTDADFIIKLIDVLPGGTQQLVRAEVLRGKFRNSYIKPEPFTPGEVTPIKLTLNDAAHRFMKGHKVMVQIQSSWFPLVDRNPQKFINIAEAGESDFQKASIRFYHSSKYPSTLEISILP